jgi:hypothetical protein
MIEAFDTNNIEKSRQLQAYAIELINIISKYGGGIVAGKHLMKIANMDCGPCRLPLNTIHREEAKAMENELRAKGLYDPIKNSFVV